MKRIKWIKDNDGTVIGLVPLGKLHNKGYAALTKSDIYYLEMLGLSFTWDRLKGGQVIAHSALSPTRHLYPSRALMDAGPGEYVAFRDGDYTNMRRGNLVKLKGGKSTRRDRDYLKPNKELSQAI